MGDSEFTTDGAFDHGRAASYLTDALGALDDAPDEVLDAHADARDAVADRLPGAAEAVAKFQAMLAGLGISVKRKASSPRDAAYERYVDGNPASRRGRTYR